jgi:hypothetical protein
MLALTREDDQVAGVVVVFVGVYVVNNLTAREIPAQNLFGHSSMLVTSVNLFVRVV